MEGARRSARRLSARASFATSRRPAQRTRLDDPAIWDDREPSEFLRHLHIAAALDIVSAMTATGLAYTAVGSACGAAGGRGRRAGAARPGRGERDDRLGSKAASGCAGSSRLAVLVGSGLVFVALVVVLIGDPSVAATRGTALPGVETAIVWLFAVQMVAMLLVGVLGFAPRRRNRAHHVGLGGIGSALVSGLALVLGAMFSAGVVLRVGDYLGQTTTSLAPARHVGPRPADRAERAHVGRAGAVGGDSRVRRDRWSSAGPLGSSRSSCARCRGSSLAVRGFFAGTPAPDGSQAERDSAPAKWRAPFVGRD